MEEERGHRTDEDLDLPVVAMNAVREIENIEETVERKRERERV